MKKNNFYLMSKLMLAFILLVSIPMIVLGVISYTSSKDAVKTQAEATIEETLNGVVSEISSKSESISDIALIVQNNDSILNYAELLNNTSTDNQDNISLNTTLANFKTPIEEILESISIIDKNGVIVSDSENGSKIGVSVFDRDYFKQSISGDNVWSNVLFSKASGNPSVVYSVPLKSKNGEINGVISFVTKFNKLTEAAKNVSIGENGYAYIINKDGLMLSHPDTSKILKENSIDANKNNPELYSILTDAAAGNSSKNTYSYQGKDKLCVYKPVGSWSVIVNIPVDEYMEAAYGIRNKTIIIVIVALIVSLLIALFVTRGITNPVKQLMDLMKKAEDGDLTVKANIKNRDEIGSLANSFNNMISGQALVMHQIIETANDVGVSAEESSSASEEMASSAQNQTAAVEELNAAMSEMSTGIQEITISITKVADNISTVTNSMELISDGSLSMAEDVNETSSSISKIADSIDEIDKSIQKVANNASTASNDAEKTVSITENGKKAAEKAISQMDDVNNTMYNLNEVIKNLGKAAIQIGDIVEVIDDIAEQTNLLALNASIEAARAGEHGKGFAVVAGAIGNLAEKSGDATKDIANLIKKIQGEIENAVTTTEDGTKKVEKGVEQVKNTGDSLDEILTAVNITTNLVKEIATLTDEQLKNSEIINKSMKNANELSMKVSAVVEEQTSSVQEVVKQLDEINSLSQNIASVSEEQSSSSEQINATAESVGEMAEQVSSASEEVANTSQSLAELASNLVEISSKFKVN